MWSEPRFYAFSVLLSLNVVLGKVEGCFALLNELTPMSQSHTFIRNSVFFAL